MADIRQIRVSFMDEATPDFVAWTDGQTWNGWECPRFEKAQADAVMAVFNGAYYDSTQDAYFTPDENFPGEFDVWHGQDWNGHHVYAIGAQSWTWYAE